MISIPMEREEAKQSLNTGKRPKGKEMNKNQDMK